MHAAEWGIAVLTVLLAVLAGALVLALWQVVLTLRGLRRTVDEIGRAHV